MFPECPPEEDKGRQKNLNVRGDFIFLFLFFVHISDSSLQLLPHFKLPNEKILAITCHLDREHLSTNANASKTDKIKSYLLFCSKKLQKTMCIQLFYIQKQSI